MRIRLLPGNSKHNRSWIHAVSDALKPLYVDRLVHEYSHWDLPDGGSIDLSVEIDRLKSDGASDVDDAVFAKSVGVILGLQAVQRRVLVSPCGIFLGTPLTDAERAGINMKELIADFPGKCLFIQQAHDPVESFSNLSSFVRGIRHDADLVQIEGNDHNYENIPEFVEIIRMWLRDNNSRHGTADQADP